MSNYITTDFLNLRSEPKIAAGNVIAVMPPDTVAEELDAGTAAGWVNLKTILGKSEVQGFASEKYLKPATAELPKPAVSAKVPLVHYPAGNRTISKHDTNTRVYPLNEQGLIKTDLKTIENASERRNTIQNVIDFLDVEHSERYSPNTTNTFCNIYAYDVAYCLGAYLPRVWWMADAITEISNGKTPQPQYDKTVSELTANSLTNWFELYGDSFSWQRTFDLTVLQDEINKGTLGIIVGQRINLNRSGHIVAIIPETSTHTVKRENGKVMSPLQSQAGAVNRKYTTGNNWWEDKTRFKKFGFYTLNLNN